MQHQPLYMQSRLVQMFEQQWPIALPTLVTAQLASGPPQK
jgi:hypothetical protein